MPTYVTAAHQSEILWLGPDRWLVLLSGGQEDVVTRRLQQAFSSGGAESTLVLDQSDSRTVFHLYGPNARDLLAKGCALDLHPVAFPPQRCTSTLLADVPILLQTLQGDDRVGPVVYRILVVNSYVQFLVQWLVCSCEAY
jgi:sarcosine oxidase subunit gamma